MTVKNEISEELKGLSEVVAGISRHAPYEGPGAAWFEGLSDRILGIVGPGAGETASARLVRPGADEAVFGDLGTADLSDIGEEGDFKPFAGIPGLSGAGLGKDKAPFGGIPEGFFEGFAATMLDKVRSQSVAAPGDIMGPDAANGLGATVELGAGGLDASDATVELGAAGLDASDATVELGVAAELAVLSPLLSGIGKGMPYWAPDGFFERISADEELGPVLASIRHKQPFQAPVNYFESFPEAILSRVRTSEEELPRIPVYQASQESKTSNEETTHGKVVRMGSRKRWLRFAGIGVAASAILVFGWLTIQSSLTGGKPSDTESNSDISKNLTRISDQDIETYLDSQHTLAEELANSTAAVDISANDLTSMLDDVSDAELKEYMEDHGTVKDLPMN